jgi:dipeptidyl aminopeptidase/acylaminoacyl peptidase
MEESRGVRGTRLHGASLNRIMRLCALVGFIACAGTKLHAQSFTLEQVMDTPFPTELTVAARGATMAWLFDQRGERNVWVAEGPAFVPHQVTRYVGDTGQPIASVRLTPDGKTVLYVRGSELNDVGRVANPADELPQPTQQVWAVPTSGGEPKLVGEVGCAPEGCEDIEISPDGKYAVWAAKSHLWIADLSDLKTQSKAVMLTDERGEPSSPVWSPDSSKIAYALSRGDHALIVIAEINAGKLAKVSYIAPSVDRDSQPRWSPDGKHLAFLRVPGPMNRRPVIPAPVTPWSIWVADAQTLQAHQIWHSGEISRDSLPNFANTSFFYAAGNRILFDSEQDGWGHLYSIDAAGGGKPSLLTPGDFEIEDVSLSADKRTVLYSSNQNDIDRRHLWSVAVAGGTPRALTQGAGIEWTPIQTADGSAVVCLGSGATTPAMVYRVAEGKRVLLTGAEMPKDFPEKELVVPKDVVFKSGDGLMIHGQLFSPKDHSKAGPGLIYVHGGPTRQMVLGFHYMDYYHYAYAMNQYLVSLGYTVLSVNYRLGVMYGHDFLNPKNAGWRGSSEYGDVLAGAQYLRVLPTVEPKRLGIWGGSYGGLLTALALARNSDIFAAGVDFHGVHDWSALLRQGTWGGDANAPDYQEALKLAWKSSPDSSVDHWKSPVLLIQGDDDRDVPFNQMVDLVQRLRQNHVPFEQIVWPDEIHVFLLYRHFIEGYKATAAFFEEHIKPAETAPVAH